MFKIDGFFDKLLNRKARKFLPQEYGAYMISGRRGAGKSAFLSFCAYHYNKKGFTVFSQYPIRNTYTIPMIHTKAGLQVDKSFIYDSDFSNTVILLDEIKTIWPSRRFKDWTVKDEEFFNFLRKNHCILIGATQDYDGVDLKVRKALNSFFYIFPSLIGAKIEIYDSELVPFANKDLESHSGFFSKPFQQIVWEIGSILVGKFTFFLKPYYSLYLTDFYHHVPKKKLVKKMWEFEVQ